MAYQGLGSEAWSGYTDSVPKTRPGYFLADLHVRYSVEQSTAVGPAVEKTVTTQVTQPQANLDADRPWSVTGSDGTGSSTNVRTSSTSHEVALPEIVCPTDAFLSEFSPRLMSSDHGPDEPISPVSQVSQ